MYQYRCEITVDAHRDTVIHGYLDHQEMKHWQPSLSEIESTLGTLFESGSQGVLHYDMSGHHMPMKVSVLDCKLPDVITMVYEVPGVVNTCVNHFDERNGQTHWVMDVVFDFKKDPPAPKEAFVAQTMRAMNQFKDYIESKRSHA